MRKFTGVPTLDGGKSNMDNKTDQIGGYSYGAKEVANSPVSLEELEQLKQTVTRSTRM